MPTTPSDLASLSEVAACPAVSTRGELRRVALGPHSAFRWSDVAAALGLPSDGARLPSLLTLD
jgi:hypothetical protein